MTVRVRRVPAPGHDCDTRLMVSQALLPLMHWRGVPVLRELYEELTVLEKFVLEMGLALGSVEPGDFTEITSLPASVLAGAAWRLISSGTLWPRGGSYGIDPDKAAAALRRQAVRRLVRAKASFALLPRTGDLLATAGQDGGWLREIEQKLSPDRLAPLPRSLWTATRTAFLSERIRAGAVAGLDAGIVDVPAAGGADPPLAELPEDSGLAGVPVCPVYLCRAEVRGSGTAAQVTSAFAYGKPQRKGKDRDPAETAEIEIDLTGARHLAAGWLELASALADPPTLLAAWSELAATQSPAADGSADGLPPLDGARRRGLGSWELLVGAGAAQRLCAQGRSLADPVGLAIEANEAVIHLSCTYFPSDDTARALFGREDVIRRLLAARQPGTELAGACRDAARRHPGMDQVFSGESVLDRIWQLGHYHLSYALREHKDFCYD